MVRIQQASACPEKLLIGSDLPNALAARRELEQWAASNGYRLPKRARQLSVFENGTLVREWVLVENEPRPNRRFPFNLFGHRKSRPDLDREREQVA